MAKKSKQMDEDTLAGAIDRQLEDSNSYHTSDIASHNELAINFFNGECDVKQMGKNRSSAVSCDVSDAHGYILPTLLDIFFSSDQVAKFAPKRQDQEDHAKQATDGVNHVVMSECEGYKHLRNGLSDGLLHGNGYIKHWWDATPEFATEDYSGLDMASYHALLNQPEFRNGDAEVLKHEEEVEENWQMPPQAAQALQQIEQQSMATGQPPNIPPALQQASTPPVLHSLSVKRIKSKGRVRIAALPYTEFRLGVNDLTLDEETAFAAHVHTKTRSQLLKDYPTKRKLIDDFEKYTLLDRDLVERDEVQHDDIGHDAIDKSMDLIEVSECYVLVDYDGDGIAERRKVVMGGAVGARNILENVEWGDELPFSDIVPDPQPHRQRGRGIFDLYASIQRTKTVLLRGVLDNTYDQLLPTRYVEEGSLDNENWEVMLDHEHGSIVVYKNGSQIPHDVVAPNITSAIAPVLDYMDSIGVKRSGIAQRSQALDLDALQNQSATAASIAQSSAYTQTKEYVRNVAECGGFKRIFLSCYKLMQKHQDKEMTIRLRGEWVQIDPSKWSPDMDLTINTGLGTGSREKDVAMLSNVAREQKEIIGKFGPLEGPVTIKDLIKTQQVLTETAGIRNAETYFPDVTDQGMQMMLQKQQQQGQQPDPKTQAAVAKAQADMQIDQQRHQVAQQRDIAEFAAKQQAAEAEREAKRIAGEQDRAAAAESSQQKMAIDIQLTQQKHDLELQLMRDKIIMEGELKREEMEKDFALKREEINLEAQLTAAKNATLGTDDFNIRQPE